VRSSRQVERLCHTDIAFKVACAGDVPDHATIARFRAVSEDAFAELFAQVLLIAARAGLARFGTIAIDGTKIPANASIDANRGRDWFDQQAKEIAAEIVEEAQRVDAAEDALAARGAGDGGDRVRGALAGRSARAERIRRAAAELTQQQRRLAADREARETGAQARLEESQAGRPVRGRIPDGPLRLAEARAHLERELHDHQAKLDRRAALIAAGKKPMGAPPVPTEEHSRIIRARRVVAAAEAAAARDGQAPTRSLPKAVANATDPESRVMPTRRGFVQGYNAQVAVTGDHLIAAVDVNQQPNDMTSFVPMMSAATNAASGRMRGPARPSIRSGSCWPMPATAATRTWRHPAQTGSSPWARATNSMPRQSDPRHPARRRPGRTHGKRWPTASEHPKDQPLTSAAAQPWNPASEPSRRS
jgi:hypothetical protein